MNGWMDGWMDVLQMDGGIDGCTDGMDKRKGRCIDGWTYKWTRCMVMDG